MMILTKEQAEAIYTILVEECGAPDAVRRGYADDRRPFVLYMCDESASGAKEYRFQGALGFGGKCRVNSNHTIPYVDYYPENRTAKRDDMMDRANERITILFAGSKS